MGLLNSALQIGRSAILSYQAALQVVGNNVGSAGSPDYTRLSPELTPLPGQTVARDLQPGAGVALTQIQRNIDEALEGRIRLAIGVETFTAQEQTTLARVESVMDNINGTDVGTRLSSFFHGFDELQNTPEDTATRDLAVREGLLLADSVRLLADQLTSLGSDLDGQIGDLVVEANALADRIAELNVEISTAEAGRRGQATGLRDQRDGLLRELSALFDVTVREQPNGSLNVYIGSESLVQAGRVRPLVALSHGDGRFTRTSVRFEDTNGQVDLGGGQIAGLIRARDVHALGRLSAVDDLAKAIADEVNRLHANGQGLTGYRDLGGSVAVLASDVSLTGPGAGLPRPPVNGSFFVSVVDDATGTPVAHRVDVVTDDPVSPLTLDSFVVDFNNQVDGVTASVTADRRIHLQADPGHTFVFGYDGERARQDTSGVLAALGINTFFSGQTASDLTVNEVLIENPLLVAAASSNHPGDGTNAGAIAALDSSPGAYQSERTLSSLYEEMSNAVAVEAGAANDGGEAASAVLSALKTQRESVSGVSLDEEAISLLKFQRAFQGAARFVTVVDDLMSELVALVR